MSVQSFKRVIAKLLPTGLAWEQVKDHPFIEGLAGEFCRINDRAADLLREIDPAQTFELIDDWEAMLGIPDECTPADQTISERRAQIIQKLATEGGLSSQFYVDISQFYGFTVQVYDNHPFRVGISRTDGEIGRLTNYYDTDVFRVGDTVGEALETYNWRYYFTVKLPIESVDLFRVGENTVGDQLAVYQNEIIQCTVRKLKPAHAAVFFLFED